MVKNDMTTQLINLKFGKRVMIIEDIGDLGVHYVTKGFGLQDILLEP